MAKKVIAAVCAVLVIAALGGVYFMFSEKPEEGFKIVSIEVKMSDGSSEVETLETDAVYLREAMEAAGISFDGAEGPYGLMVHTVNGEYAEYNETGAYWSFSVNGEYCNYGIDSQPVNNNDAFVIAYTVA